MGEHNYSMDVTEEEHKVMIAIAEYQHAKMGAL